MVSAFLSSSKNVFLLVSKTIVFVCSEEIVQGFRYIEIFFNKFPKISRETQKTLDAFNTVWNWKILYRMAFDGAALIFTLSITYPNEVEETRSKLGYHL